jgi:[acyl-carrier-protein] S-malonyltransferase
MFDGSESELRATNYAQPALFLTSLAIVRVLEEEFGIIPSQWRLMAGHSLGEYTALHVAGVISLQQTLELIKIRGTAMATIKDGGMIAVMGIAHDVLIQRVQDLNDEGIGCFLANDNSPQQAVISAAAAHLPLLAERLSAFGALKSVILNVSGPFHSAMMASAQDIFAPVLGGVPFSPPCCPMVTNVSGKEQNDATIIKDHMRQQMTHPVLWRTTQLTLAGASVTHIIEIGSGKVLSGLAKKTIPNVQICALNTIGAIQDWQNEYHKLRIHQTISMPPISESMAG